MKGLLCLSGHIDLYVVWLLGQGVEEGEREEEVCVCAFVGLGQWGGVTAVLTGHISTVVLHLHNADREK